MKPIGEMPAELRRQVAFVLTDIDGTLTHEGRLPAASYASLERLQRSGRRVIPVTGRPAGWCDLIARQWPVDAVVGENGAFAFRYDDASHRMHRLYARSDAERAVDRRKLNVIAEAVQAKIPEARIASDQPYRIADLAVDFAEDVPHLHEAHIDRIVETFKRAGATAKVSSIHVNGWFGDYDKLSMALLVLKEFFDMSSSAAKAKAIFIGDSPNDAPMFEFFPNSVGVANVTEYAQRIDTLPAWVTSGRSATGFCEFVDELLRDS